MPMAKRSNVDRIYTDLKNMASYFDIKPDEKLNEARMAEQPGAIGLECTNMAPYAADIRVATGFPLFSIYNFITWFQQGLQPRQSF